MTERELIPAYVPYPGELIAELIEERDWSQTKLAEIMGRPTQVINEIINGKREITPETALQLAAAFGSSEQFFMNLETRYRLWVARRKNVDRLEEIRQRAQESMPKAS